MKFYVLVFGLFIFFLVLSYAFVFAIDAFRDARRVAKARRARRAVQREIAAIVAERRVSQQVGRR